MILVNALGLNLHYLFVNANTYVQRAMNKGEAM